MIPTPFDFSEALRLAPLDRMRRAVAFVRGLDLESAADWTIPPIPAGGASTAEIRKLERESGVALPSEYAEFLGHWRYLMAGDADVWGPFREDEPGTRPYLTSPRALRRPTPWSWIKGLLGLSSPPDRDVDDRRYLAFADLYRYGESGSLLLFDLDDPDTPVAAYLAGRRPAFEPYAPSFSLALWRLTNEK